METDQLDSTLALAHRLDKIHKALSDEEQKRLSTRTFWVSTISLFTAVLAILISIWWSSHLIQRDAENRAKTALDALRLEVILNLQSLEQNGKILDEELAALRVGRSVVEPFVPLANSAWDLVKLNMPEGLRERGPEALGKILTMHRLLEQVSSTMQSREAFRISGGLTGSYAERLELYDRTLAKEFYGLGVVLRSVNELLGVGR